jgi:very-short-patch-repair endonuclease
MPTNSIPYLDNLYYGASNELIRYAKSSRSNMTPSENTLWQHIKNNQLAGYKFRRQHPIATFIADFYCHQKRLVLEIDGGYHNTTSQQKTDINRTAELERFGIQVLRFTNNEIENSIETVLDIIRGRLLK